MTQDMESRIMVWAVLLMQAVLLGLAGWTLHNVHKHETRIVALEEWRGGERAYTPTDARGDMRRINRELASVNSVLDGYARRIRKLEIIIGEEGGQ